MTTAELYDRILSTLETAASSEFDRDSNAREAAKARRENTAALAEVRELLAGLKAAHPDLLLEKLQRRELALVHQQAAITRAENNLVSKAGPSAEENSLTERITETMHREQQLTRSVLLEAHGVTDCRSLPLKFVRGDALEFFRREVDEAENKIAELLKPYNRPNVNPGPRTRTQVNELQAVIDEWPRTEKLCKLGEQVHALRVERQQLTEERAALVEQRRREVLAV